MAALVIVNPRAGGGKVGRLWPEVAPLLRQHLPDAVFALTHHIDDVPALITDAVSSGADRVIAVGGDGTNNIVVNALMTLHEQQPGLTLPAFGSLPIGTGRDWARSLDVPREATAAADWLRDATPHPVDVGHLHTDDRDRYFLNIASAGISGVIDAHVNRVLNRRAWTFLAQTVRALLTYEPGPLRVFLDDDLWYEGKAFIAAVANGRSFGHGMLVAPNASFNDGLFDVVLVENMPLPNALMALPTLYNGTHLQRADVHEGRAQAVRIESPSGPLDLDIDGEHDRGQNLRFAVVSGVLTVLHRPG